MEQFKLDHSVNKAEQLCRESGARLTTKRKNLLALLIGSSIPQSAYELAEMYKKHYQDAIPAMSVYRMLDFFIEHNLVHKLNSTNKYLACDHIACEHHHEVPQFLICDQCHEVSEIGVKREIVDQLKESVMSTGFKLSHQQLELHGRCKACQLKA